MPLVATSFPPVIETVPVDLARQSESKPECRGHDGRAAGVPSCPRAEPGVYLIIPYEITVPAREYLTYLDDYVVPQLKGWMDEGVLASYGVYLARYPAGRPWQNGAMGHLPLAATLAELRRCVPSRRRTP